MPAKIDQLTPRQLHRLATLLAGVFEARQEKTGRPLRLTSIWKRVEEHSAGGLPGASLDPEAYAEVSRTLAMGTFDEVVLAAEIAPR